MSSRVGSKKAYSRSSSGTALQGLWLSLAWKRTALRESCELRHWHLPHGGSRATMCGIIVPHACIVASHKAFLEIIHLHTCNTCIYAEADESGDRKQWPLHMARD
jgi:hypothetical protein